MKNLVLVLKKELYRVFSDRKLIISLFVVPAVLMFAIYSLIGTLAKSMSSDIESHVPKTCIVNATETLKDVMGKTGFKEGAKITYLSDEEYSAMCERAREAAKEFDYPYLAKKMAEVIESLYL